MGKGYPSVFGLGLCVVLLHTCQASFLSQQATQRNVSPSNYWECYFQTAACSGGAASNEMSPQTRDEVANILKGVIENLSKHKGFVQLSETTLMKEAKGVETKKAMLGLLTVFRTNRDAALRIVSNLVGKPKASLSAISIAAEPSKVAAPALPPVKSAGKPAPKGPIVKK